MIEEVRRMHRVAPVEKWVERAIAPTTVVERSAHPPIFPSPVEAVTPGTSGPSPTVEALTPEGNNGRNMAETWQGARRN